MDRALLKGLLGLQACLEGDLYMDDVNRLLYATDASIYREKPLAVTRPKNKDDIRKIMAFASENRLGLIPRAAGTSLAGQVVGNGIVVDISKYMTRVLEINIQERWIRVEPGVILDEMNQQLALHGLFFGPETSTSNRCMIGGMLGNNACGSHSLIHGSTRDHTLEVKVILSDGSEATFGPITPEVLEERCRQNNLEGKIYRTLNSRLSDPLIREEIQKQYPDPSVHRRNTGYALDKLVACSPFQPDGPPLNLSLLLAGSEGTLAFATEIKLNLIPLPPPVVGLLCAHFHTREEAFRANLIALKYNPGALEMMDSTILNLTRDNIDQQRNRFFINGDPGAILIIEFARNEPEEIETIVEKIKKELLSKNLGYHFPLLFGTDTKKVWSLRKAGLGVLSTMKGDAKPVSLVEDTAVPVESLPGYMEEFRQIMEKYHLDCVYHAHIGSGELHLRPVLNLKDPHDTAIFHDLGKEVALLVKKYRGSLSGEHGDGRLRGSFIPLMYGEKVYALFKEIKGTFDPANLMNPGKIIDPPPMNACLRYLPGQSTRNFDTVFDFQPDGGLLRAIEKCNGSGDCRKTEKLGGTMCPSYMAMRDENTTTRARANLLREVLSDPLRKNPFDDRSLYDILDLCLSCKGCKAECPSNIDMAKFKAEFLQHYHDSHGLPLRTRVIAHISRIQKMGSLVPSLYNLLVTSQLLSKALKKTLSFASERSLPKLYKYTLHHWIRHHLPAINPCVPTRGRVLFFVDEFTNYNDTEIGMRTIELLVALGYRVEVPEHEESGRAYISKGLLRAARDKADRNIELFSSLMEDGTPLVGIEPSAILSFRDEYPELCSERYREAARRIASHVFTIDEFIDREFCLGNIRGDQFDDKPQAILLHGHCQQKSISTMQSTLAMLRIPSGNSVEEIPSGCCGMAGSFGYEKEHYELSMKVGELVLFNAIRSAPATTLIAATGTSCRHQIFDGTGRKALHPAEILYSALKKKEEVKVPVHGNISKESASW